MITKALIIGRVDAKAGLCLCYSHIQNQGLSCFVIAGFAGYIYEFCFMNHGVTKSTNDTQILACPSA